MGGDTLLSVKFYGHTHSFSFSSFFFVLGLCLQSFPLLFHTHVRTRLLCSRLLSLSLFLSLSFLLEVFNTSQLNRVSIPRLFLSLSTYRKKSPALRVSKIRFLFVHLFHSFLASNALVHAHSLSLSRSCLTLHTHTHTHTLRALRIHTCHLPALVRDTTLSRHVSTHRCLFTHTQTRPRLLHTHVFHQASTLTPHALLPPPSTLFHTLNYVPLTRPRSLSLHVRLTKDFSLLRSPHTLRRHTHTHRPSPFTSLNCVVTFRSVLARLSLRRARGCRRSSSTRTRGNSRTSKQHLHPDD